ncbi:MAG: ABC transporter permease [Thermoanaerobaculia bacterium]
MVLPKQEQNQGQGGRPPGEADLGGRLAIRDQVAGVRLITPLIAAPGRLVKYRDRQHGTMILGVNQDWPETNNHQVEVGRFFSEIDLRHRRKVAVIGRKIVEELGLSEPVGSEIYVGDLPVTVIGVMEKRGQALGQDSDDLAFLPFETALSVLGREAGEQIQLRLQATDASVVEQVKDGITQVLRQRHKIAEGQPADFQ